MGVTSADVIEQRSPNIDHSDEPIAYHHRKKYDFSFSEMRKTETNARYNLSVVTLKTDRTVREMPITVAEPLIALISAINNSKQFKTKTYIFRFVEHDSTSQDA